MIGLNLSIGLTFNSAQFSAGGGGGIPTGDWILAAGLWDDLGVWRDDQNWID